MEQITPYTLLFEGELSKAQVTQIHIAKATIQNIVQRGVDFTTFQSIAATAGLSRTIVARYFRDREDLFLFVAKYVRLNYQHFVVSNFSSLPSAGAQIESYLESALDWVDKFPDHARTFLLFFYYCGIKKEFRDINTQMVQTGHLRLRALIEKGISESEFQVDSVDPLAKQLHLFLTGAILSKMTEDPANTINIKNDTLNFFRTQLGYRGREYAYDIRQP